MVRAIVKVSLPCFPPACLMLRVVWVVRKAHGCGSDVVCMV